MFTMWNLPLRVMLTVMMGELGCSTDDQNANLDTALDEFHVLGKIHDCKILAIFNSSYLLFYNAKVKTSVQCLHCFCIFYFSS